ncbi:MAG: DUF3108 domain-containing protein [Candidatus Neomarinimicrobiota bacterium]
MRILFLLIFSVIFANDRSWDEKLLYNASFGGIDVATATLKSKKIINIENQDILRIEFKAKSRPSLKYIFPINDKIIVDVDLNTWQPLKVEKKIREGSYKQNSLSTFDHKNNIFIYKKDSISYEGEIFNPYSLIYYFRTLDFHSDSNYKIQVVDNKKVTPLKFFTDKKVEVKTAFGKFYANKIWPKKINGEPFKNAGKITVWVSDKDKLPIIINLKMKFGSLNLELKEVN